MKQAIEAGWRWVLLKGLALGSAKPSSKYFRISMIFEVIRNPEIRISIPKNIFYPELLSSRFRNSVYRGA